MLSPTTYICPLCRLRHAVWGQTSVSFSDHSGSSRKLRRSSWRYAAFTVSNPFGEDGGSAHTSLAYKVDNDSCPSARLKVSTNANKCSYYNINNLAPRLKAHGHSGRNRLAGSQMMDTHQVVPTRAVYNRPRLKLSLKTRMAKGHINRGPPVRK